MAYLAHFIAGSSLRNVYLKHAIQESAEKMNNFQAAKSFVYWSLVFD